MKNEYKAEKIEILDFGVNTQVAWLHVIGITFIPSFPTPAYIEHNKEPGSIIFAELFFKPSSVMYSSVSVIRVSNNSPVFTHGIVPFS